MKRSMVFTILAMVLPMISQAHEVEETEVQKLYVEPSQIAFANGGMFANFGGEWVPLDAIYTDASGLLAAIKKDPNHNRWHCPECNYNNDGWSKTCQKEYDNGEKCGYPRPW